MSRPTTAGGISMITSLTGRVLETAPAAASTPSSLQEVRGEENQCWDRISHVVSED
jgi:hypothetical protein